MNMLNISVLVAPTSGITLERELELLKTALLYGDTVTLCSPKVSMLQGLAPLENLKTEQLLDIVTSIISENPSVQPNLDPKALPLVSTVAKKIMRKKREFSRSELILRQKMTTASRQVIENFRQFNNVTGNTELSRLVSAGILQLHDFKSIKAEEMTEEFVTLTASSVADGKAYPLYDAGASDFLSSISKAKPFGDIDSNRIKHVKLADSLFSRMPNFSHLTLDEVVGIRSELDRYLINFRSKLVGLSQKITSMVWDKDFEKEVDLLTYSDIAPAFDEIDEQMKATSALRNYLRQPKDVLKATTERATIGAIISQFLHLDTIALTMLGAAIGAGTGAFQKFLESRNDAHKNQLFFYYGLSKQITRTTF